MGATWTEVSVDIVSVKGKSYGLPLWEGSKAAMYFNKGMFKEAGIAEPPATFPDLIAAAQKLVKFDASGKMTRSGISLRLSAQGDGIAEQFAYLLAAADRPPIV